MSIYFSRAISGRVPEPRSILHPSLKDEKWFRQWCEYIYSTNIDYSDTLSNKISELRSYSNGKQSTERYRTILDDELETTQKIPDEVYSRKDQNLKSSRSGLSHINYAQVFNPMPIYIQTILGLFEDSNYALRCYAQNEFSNDDRDVLKFRKQLLKDNPDLLTKLNTDEFVPKNNIELDMLMKVGGFKLPYEIACEKLFDYTSELSDEPQVRRKVLKDLIEIRRAAVMAYTENGRVKYRYVDVDNTMVEYSTETGYDNSRFWGAYELLTIQQIREETGWEESKIRQIADTCRHLYENGKYKEDNIESMKYYDSYRIPVMRMFFRSTDTNYFDERVNSRGEFIRTEVMYDNAEPKMHNKDKLKTVKEDLQRVYQCSYIVGTDHVFSYGIFANQAFDYTNNRPLPPIIHYQLPVEVSIVESAIPALDQLAIAYYKFQNNMAIAAPAGMAYDLNLLENIEFDAKQWDALDLIDLRTKTGNFIYRSTPTGGGFQPSDSAKDNLPFPMQSEALAAINEATQAFSFWFRNLSSLTGLDQFTLLSKTPTSDTTATAINAAASTTSATLRPIIEGWTNIHKKLFYTTMYMLQGYVLDDDMAYNRYASIVGKEYMASLKIAAEREPLVLGIKAVQSPNAEIKQEILNSARIAMQPKDGISALSMGEYLFIVNELLNNSGIEHARLILSSREQEAEEKRIKVSQENIKLQAEGNKQLEMIKQDSMIKQMGLEALNNYNKAKFDAYFKAQLENSMAANQILMSTYDKTIESMINGQIPQVQQVNPMQQQPQQVMPQEQIPTQ